MPTEEGGVELPAVTPLRVEAASSLEVDGGCSSSAVEEGPLHAAAKNDKPDEVRALIEARADPGVRDRAFGWTALHVAAGNDACHAATALLELGAPVDAPANDGETPLHLAAAEGKTQAIRLLVKMRADVNQANADSETALHVAVQHLGGKPGLGHIRTLLELRADVSVRDKAGHSAWETAGIFTNRAEEVRDILGGKPPQPQDPDDPWPDTVGELEDGTDPLTAAEALRELGNKRFREGQYERAVKYYFKAKVFLPTGPSAHAPVAEGDEYASKARACQIAVSSNAAACKLKLGEFDVCVRMCDGILALDAGNTKALYRKSLALRAQDDIDGAESALRKAANLEPRDAAIQKELADIALQRKKDRDREKRLAKNMFG